jgi:monoamine oxidase
MAFARMSLGDEPERISALDYARLWAGDDLVVRQGYGTLVERAAEGLDIRLSTPVEAIDWSGAGVRVTTRSGVIGARAAIVTLPVGVLQRGGVRFTPELPQRTRDGLAGLGMGALTKVALKFNGERFGMPAGMDIWERLGPRRSFNFECFTYDRDVVIAFFGGDHAREVMAQGEQGAVRVVLNEFKRMVGAQAEKAFVAGKLAGWATDPFSFGAYSHALPGRANARALLAEPVGDRIWFAGEATAGVGPGEDFGGAMTAGGAWIAGTAAANKIASIG